MQELGVLKLEFKFWSWIGVGSPTLSPINCVIELVTQTAQAFIFSFVNGDSYMNPIHFYELYVIYCK